MLEKIRQGIILFYISKKIIKQAMILEKRIEIDINRGRSPD